MCACGVLLQSPANLFKTQVMYDLLRTFWIMNLVYTYDKPLSHWTKGYELTDNSMSRHLLPVMLSSFLFQLWHSVSLSSKVKSPRAVISRSDTQKAVFSPRCPMISLLFLVFYFSPNVLSSVLIFLPLVLAFRIIQASTREKLPWIFAYHT